MKVLLNICGAGFIAKDAATAAKVADLLGDMKPVSRGWLEVGPVLIEGHDKHSDEIEVIALQDRVPMKRKDYERQKDERQQAEKLKEAPPSPNS